VTSLVASKVETTFLDFRFRSRLPVHVLTLGRPGMFIVNPSFRSVSDTVWHSSIRADRKWNSDIEVDTIALT